MKHLNEFLNEEETYRNYVGELKTAFRKTGIEEHLYDNQLVVSASGWPIGHPNGSIGITFWLMDDDIDIKKLQKVAKSFAKKHGFIASTFYPNGIESNADSSKTQDWRNKAAMGSNFVYGFTFYNEGNDTAKKIYTILK